MRVYLVAGPGFHVGPGCLVLLPEAALADRRHRLAQIVLSDGAVLARATETQGFIPGEVLGLEELPLGQSGLALPVTVAESFEQSLLLEAVKRFAALAKKEAKAADQTRVAAARQRREEEARVADAADVRRWTDEWQSVDLVRARYRGDSKKFLADKRAEREAMAREVAAREQARIREDAEFNERQAEDAAKAAAQADAGRWGREWDADPELQKAFPTKDEYLAGMKSAAD